MSKTKRKAEHLSNCLTIKLVKRPVKATETVKNDDIYLHNELYSAAEGSLLIRAVSLTAEEAFCFGRGDDGH